MAEPGRTRWCWRAEVAASPRGHSSAWRAGRASPPAEAGRCCEPRRPVTGCCSAAPARARAWPRRSRPRRSRAHVAPLRRSERRGAVPLGAAAHLRHHLVGEPPERRAGDGDDPVRRTASEPQAGVDAAGQDHAWVHLSPHSRSTSWWGSSWRWTSSLPLSWPRSSWPVPSGFGRCLLGRCLLGWSHLRGRCRRRFGRRHWRSAVVRPRPLASAHLGGHCAHRGGGRADRRADHLLASADRVLHGPGDRADHVGHGEVRDDLDRAERVLRGPPACPSGAGQLTRGRVNHGKQVVRARSTCQETVRNGSCSARILSTRAWSRRVTTDCVSWASRMHLASVKDEVVR